MPIGLFVTQQVTYSPKQSKKYGRLMAHRQDEWSQTQRPSIEGFDMIYALAVCAPGSACPFSERRHLCATKTHLQMS